MKLNDIFNKDTSEKIIAELKSHRSSDQPNVSDARKALDISKHIINNSAYRKDKFVKIDDPNAPNEDGYRMEKVARIALALQKLIVKRSVAFLFGNQVDYHAETQNEKQELIMKALKRVLHDVKENSLNRKVARSVFGFKECAELWYPVEKKHSNYGFNSKFRLRCVLFSPEFGDTLYPYFDETGDMIAFSREFSRRKMDKFSIHYFETYTDTQHFMWMKKELKYELMEGFPKPIAIGKIPVVYACQDEFETQDVDKLIDRLELLLSNFADTNDYHASPKIFVKGELKGFSKKGESGAIIEGEDGADAKYLSWANAPESVKLEIETLLRMIYTITQTPDISFESVKGLGAISGIALQLLFMDAHLKVQDKKEVFDEHLQRRVNVIKAFIGKFNIELEDECDLLEIEPQITPYMLTSEIDDINKWLAANGNKPLISQKQSIKNAGLTSNPNTDFEQIQEEASRENTFIIGEPTDA